MRRRLRQLLLLVLAGGITMVSLGLFLGACVFAGPRYHGPATDHFDGERFHNPNPHEHGFSDFLRWSLNREAGQWPDWLEAAPGPPPEERVDGDRMRITFINHATTLIQVAGTNILTDPIWNFRASPVSFAGPRRRRPPGIRFDDLPPIHVVLVSHNHYDHLDLPSLRRLAEEHQPRILVGLGNRALLEREGIAGAEELDWWRSKRIGDALRITSVPSRHFSGRGFGDRNATLWTSYVIDTPAGRAYFAGDTGSGDHFRQIGARFGPLRLAILPIGAYRPRWFMSPVHIDPAQAVAAHFDLRAGTSVGMHFGTFPLADDAMDEPVRELEKALLATKSARGTRPRFWTLGFGEGRDVPALSERPAAVETDAPRDAPSSPEAPSRERMRPPTSPLSSK